MATLVSAREEEVGWRATAQSTMGMGRNRGTGGWLGLRAAWDSVGSHVQCTVLWRGSEIFGGVRRGRAVACCNTVIHFLVPCCVFPPPLQVALEMYGALTDIQTEKADDKFGWVMPVN